MSLTEIKTYLAKFGLSARKNFSQNFLFNDAVLCKIIELIPLGKGFYFEVGGGLGSLTKYAVERQLFPLTVADLDDSMLKVLQLRFGNFANVVKKDCANIEFSQYFQGVNGFVFGSLPYQSSSLIVMNSCFEASFLDGALFLVQKEVAEKFCALPGSRNFGPIAALIRLVGQAEALFDVSPNNFFPVPKVYSTVLKVTFNDHACSREKLRTFVDAARILFSNRRKRLQNVFKINSIDPSLLTRFNGVQFKRAEELDWETILKICEEIRRSKR